MIKDILMQNLQHAAKSQHAANIFLLKRFRFDRHCKTFEIVSLDL